MTRNEFILERFSAYRSEGHPPHAATGLAAADAAALECGLQEAPWDVPLPDWSRSAFIRRRFLALRDSASCTVEGARDAAVAEANALERIGGASWVSPVSEADVVTSASVRAAGGS